jgi:hypothetical protein
VLDGGQRYRNEHQSQSSGTSHDSPWTHQTPGDTPPGSIVPPLVLGNDPEPPHLVQCFPIVVPPPDPPNDPPSPPHDPPPNDPLPPNDPTPPMDHILAVPEPSGLIGAILGIVAALALRDRLRVPVKSSC